MTIFPVEMDGGVFSVRFAPDRIAPIRLGGVPVQVFGPGWRPRLVHGGFTPLYLLELENEDGQEATWYLDADLERIAGELEELSAEHRALIADRYAAMAGDPWQSLLASPRIGATAAAGLDALNPRTARGIATLHHPRGEAPLAWVGLADIPFGDAIILPGAGSIATDHLRALLSTDLQDIFLAAMRTGTLEFPSPATGRPIADVHSLYIDNMMMMFRCYDAERDLLFHVVAVGHHMQTVGVLLPALDRVFYFTPLQKHFADSLAADLRARVDRFLRRHATPLAAYLAAPPAGFVTPLWGAGFHIGHHLWNELTGLARAVAELPWASLPQVAVLGQPGEGEAYGPIGALFPELAPRLVRELPNDDAFMQLVFERRWQVLRLTGELVGEDLRRRIMVRAGATSGLEADHALLARLRQEATPVVVLGLRVENRTVADFEQFALRVVEHLQARLGRVAVVLDGHNARTGGSEGSYPSFVEGRASTPPVDVERHIARVLARQFEGSGVTIIDNVGRSMEAGLFWIGAAQFFIAPWGAGLAKYRWVANKPGVIVSSRWVLTEKGDVHIYDQERYMEAPSPVVFLDPEDAFDIGDEPVLVQVFDPHHPMYYNFKINMGGLYRLIDRMIAMTPQPAPLPA